MTAAVATGSVLAVALFPRISASEPAPEIESLVAITPASATLDPVADEGREPVRAARSQGEREAGDGVLTVYTVPPAKTYVYLNGSRLLGEAPLRNAAIPSGRHRLVLWSPEAGFRTSRTIEVVPGGAVTVIENVPPEPAEPAAPHPSR